MAASRGAQAQDLARKAAAQARSGVSTAATAAERLRAALRSRRQARPARRPDGTLVSPGPAAPARDGASASPVAAPFIRARNALRDRWQDAVREGKLAAREKEEEIRAGYESRVQHRGAWHAQQQRRIEGPKGTSGRPPGPQ